MVRKKTQNLNKTNLKKLNNIAHLNSFSSKIKSIKDKYDVADNCNNDGCSRI